MRNMAPRSEVRLLLYGYEVCLFKCVYSSLSNHTLLPSPYLLVYPLSGASRVTDMLALNESENTALG